MTPRYEAKLEFVLRHDASEYRKAEASINISLSSADTITTTMTPLASFAASDSSMKVAGSKWTFLMACRFMRQWEAHERHFTSMCRGVVISVSNDRRAAGHRPSHCRASRYVDIEADSSMASNSKKGGRFEEINVVRVTRLFHKCRVIIICTISEHARSCNDAVPPPQS